MTFTSYLHTDHGEKLLTGLKQKRNQFMNQLLTLDPITEAVEIARIQGKISILDAMTSIESFVELAEIQ